MQAVLEPIIETEASVFVQDKEAMRWVDASRPGLRLAAVHEDRRTGRFLGLLGFDTMASSGLHHHVDIAFSYVLSGGLTDYAGTTVGGQMGINMPGATHDAIAYLPTLMASRLDGPILYAPDAGHADAPHLHAGARVQNFENPRPEESPDVSIFVERLPAHATSVAGLSRRLICDYEGHAPRLPQQRHHNDPAHTRSGVPHEGACRDLHDRRWHEGQRKLVLSGGFCVVEPGTQVQMSSGFGAFFLAWSEAPVEWLDGPRADLFGF